MSFLLHVKEEQFRPLDEDLLKYTFYSLQPTFVVVAVVVQLLSCVQLFVTPWTEELQASLFFTISWSLLKVMSTESVMPSNHLFLCHPRLLLPSIFPSIRVFLKSQLFVTGGQPTFIHAYPAFLSWCLRITKINDSTLGLWVERHSKSIHHPNQSNGSRAGIIFIFQMKKLRFRG